MGALWRVRPPRWRLVQEMSVTSADSPTAVLVLVAVGSLFIALSFRTDLFISAGRGWLKRPKRRATKAERVICFLVGLAGLGRAVFDVVFRH